MWKPAPVFLPRVSHGQRSPWGHTESETAEVTEHARTRRGQSNTDEVVKSVGKYNREDINQNCSRHKNEKQSGIPT